jgi:hypothetical protein
MKLKTPNFWGLKTPTKHKPIKNIQPLFLKGNKLNEGYPKRSMSEMRLIDKKPYGDKDKDGLMNWFDCKPKNKHKTSAMMREHLSQKLYGESFKDLKKQSKEYSKNKTQPYIDKAYRQIRHINKQVPRKKEMFKYVTPVDVVKHFQKYPQQLKETEGAEFRYLHPEEVYNKTERTGETFLNEGSYTDITSKEGHVLVAPYMFKESNVGQRIEHELVHHKQNKEKRLSKPAYVNENKWSEANNREWRIDPEEVEAEETSKKIIKERKEFGKEETPEVLQSLEERETIDEDIGAGIMAGDYSKEEVDDYRDRNKNKSAQELIDET